MRIETYFQNARLRAHLPPAHAPRAAVVAMALPAGQRRKRKPEDFCCLPCALMLPALEVEPAGFARLRSGALQPTMAPRACSSIGRTARRSRKTLPRGGVCVSTQPSAARSVA
jgi:hypothetical protein